jgi:hypothetical protein
MKKYKREDDTTFRKALSAKCNDESKMLKNKLKARATKADLSSQKQHSQENSQQRNSQHSSDDSTA